jgi:hypothetical protein
MGIALKILGNDPKGYSHLVPQPGHAAAPVYPAPGGKYEYNSLHRGQTMSASSITDGVSITSPVSASASVDQIFSPTTTIQTGTPRKDQLYENIFEFRSEPSSTAQPSLPSTPSASGPAHQPSEYMNLQFIKKDGKASMAVPRDLERESSTDMRQSIDEDEDQLSDESVDDEDYNTVELYDVATTRAAKSATLQSMGSGTLDSKFKLMLEKPSALEPSTEEWAKHGLSARRFIRLYDAPSWRDHGHAVCYPDRH